MKLWLRSLTLGAGFGAALFAFAACSSDDKDSGGGGPTSATDVNDFVAKYCSYVGTCCGQSGYPTDGAVCRALFSSVGTAGYDKSKGDACLAALSAASTKNDFCTGGFEAPPECNMTSGGGAVAPGGECKADSDCATPATGDASCAFEFTSTASKQTCLVVLHGKAGESCSGTVTKVPNGTSTSRFGDDTASTRTYCFTDEGLSCSAEGTAYTCKPLGKNGDSCRSGDDCVSGRCDAAICADKVLVGGACLYSAECQSDLWCDDNGKCAAKLGDGGACTKSDSCNAGSCVNGKCDPSGGFGDFALTLLCGPKG